MNYLQSFGLKADHILPLTWGLLVISLLVILSVIALLLRSLFVASETTVGSADTAAVERPWGGTRWIAIGVGLTAFVLLLSAVWAMGTLAAIGEPPARPAVTVEVIGHQWWWEIRYHDDKPSRVFTTANEIRIPVGKPALFRLKSADVIHSFWVPALGGKTDLIPGQTNVTWLQADKQGVYRGQCAEYCGMQHAHMALVVVASDPESFESWWRHQLEPPPAPASERVASGKQSFLQKCGACHSVRGTPAGGIVGPDLSHLMQRKTIAAGTLVNTTAHLAAWIADPQHIKPGNFMPRPEVSSAELQKIIAYLQTLE